MKSSASKSVRNAYFNSERLSRSLRLARPGISTVERLWNGFVQYTELLMYRTKCINYNKVFCKHFGQNKHFSPFWFSSVGIKIGVSINSGGLNSLFGSALIRIRFGSWKVRRLNRAFGDVLKSSDVQCVRYYLPVLYYTLKSCYVSVEL